MTKHPNAISTDNNTMVVTNPNACATRGENSNQGQAPSQDSKMPADPSQLQQQLLRSDLAALNDNVVLSRRELLRLTIQEVLQITGNEEFDEIDGPKNVR